MEQSEPREDAKRQVMWSKGHVESDLSVAGRGLWVDRTGHRQETPWTQSLQGIPEIKCFREKRLKTEIGEVEVQEKR